MFRGIVLGVIFSLVLTVNVNAQKKTIPEKELKEKAAYYFDNKEFGKARPLYAQLLALYQRNTEYNYKYGATLLESTRDKSSGLRYLEYAAKQSDVSPLAFFYLGKSYHLNYNFDKAIVQYKKFKERADKKLQDEYQIERYIEMCMNGKVLVGDIHEIQVLEKRIVSEDNFYRIYDLIGIKGRIIAKPSAFMSKYDKKVKDKSIIFLPEGNQDVYYSSYGQKGENGRDIYKISRQVDNQWGKPENLGEVINTPYDEDYAFIHPDGVTLYFASKGHNSMGGYDLYKSTYNKEKEEWSKPENLGFSFSSVGDDILFISDKGKELAYFASNRNNDENEITVYKVRIGSAPTGVLIKGRLIAEESRDISKKVPVARISVFDKNSNQLIGAYTTNEDGEYEVVIPDGGGEFKFTIETTEDQPLHTAIVDVPSESLGILGQELRLTNNGDEQELEVLNIFDGSLVEKKEPQTLLSAEALAKKALLDVNMSEEEKQLAHQIAIKKAEEADLIPEEIEEEKIIEEEEKVLALAEEKEPAKVILQEETAEDLVKESEIEEAIAEKKEGKAEEEKKIQATIAEAYQQEIESLEHEAIKRLDELETLAAYSYSMAIEHQAITKNKRNEARIARRKEEENWVQIEREANKEALKATLLLEQAETIEKLIAKEIAQKEKLDYNKELIIKAEVEQEVEKLLAENKEIVNQISTLNSISIEQETYWAQSKRGLTESIKKEQAKVEKLIKEIEAVESRLATEGDIINRTDKRKLQSVITALEKQLQAREEIIADLRADVLAYEEQQQASKESIAAIHKNELALQKIEDKEKAKLKSEVLVFDNAERYEKSLTKLDKELEVSLAEIPVETVDEKAIVQLKEDEKHVSIPKTKEVTIDDIKDNSIIDMSYSSLVIHQSFEYANQNTKKDVLEAKKLLFEAKQYNQLAEEKKELVYELNSPEERGDVFIEASELEQKSKEKQIEAVKRLSEANEKEYASNVVQLSTAENTTIESIKVESLLNEAASHFNQADELKATLIQTEDISKLEAIIQEVYDHEILAIEKQKEAISILEVEKSALAINESGDNELVKQDAISKEVILLEVPLEEASREDLIIDERKQEELTERNPTITVEDTEITEKSIELLEQESITLIAKAKELRKAVKVSSSSEERNSLNQQLVQLLDSVNSKQEVLAERRSNQEASIDYNKTQFITETTITRPAEVDVVAIAETEVEISKAEERKLKKSTEYIEHRAREFNLQQLKNEVSHTYTEAVALKLEQEELKLELQQLRKEEALAQSLAAEEEVEEEIKAIEGSIEKIQYAIEALNFEINSQNEILHQEFKQRGEVLSKLDERQQKSISYLVQEELAEVKSAEELETFVALYSQESKEEGTTVFEEEQAVKETIGESNKELADAREMKSLLESIEKREEQLQLPAIETEEVNLTAEEEKSIMQTKDYQKFSAQQYDLIAKKKEMEAAYHKSLSYQMDQSDLRYEVERLKELSETAEKSERKALKKEAKVIEKRADKKQKGIESLAKVIAKRDKEIEKGIEKRDELLSNIPQAEQAEVLYLTEKYEGELIVPSEGLAEYEEETFDVAEFYKADTIINLQDVGIRNIVIDTIDIVTENQGLILESKDFVAFSSQQYKLYELKKENDQEYLKLLTLQVEQEDLKYEAQELRTQAAEAPTRAERKRLVKEAKVIDLKVQESQAQIDSLSLLVVERNNILNEEIEYRNDIFRDIPKEKQASIFYLTERYKANPAEIEEVKRLAKEEPVIEKPLAKVEEEVIEEEEISIKNINVIPRKLDKAIFLTIDNKSSAYDVNRPIPKKEELPEGLVFKVQIGAFRNPIPQDMFKGFAPIMIEDAANGIKRYTAGLFNLESLAENARDEIRALGYRDAFIVAYYNGKRIGIAEARNIFRREGVQEVFAEDIGSTSSSTSVISGSIKVSDNAKIEDASRTSPSTTVVNERVSAQTAVGEIPIITTEEDKGRINVKEVEEVFFTVQIGVFSKPIEAGLFDDYEPLNFVILPTGLRRYNTGIFKNIEEARAYRSQIISSIPDAFVTAYYQGERITIERANQLLTQ